MLTINTLKFYLEDGLTEIQIYPIIAKYYYSLFLVNFDYKNNENIKLFINNFDNNLFTKYLDLDNFSWNHISALYKLNEKFIKKFKNKVNWYWIVNKQKLSKKFIDDIEYL